MVSTAMEDTVPHLMEAMVVTMTLDHTTKGEEGIMEEVVVGEEVEGDKVSVHLATNCIHKHCLCAHMMQVTVRDMVP